MCFCFTACTNTATDETSETTVTQSTTAEVGTTQAETSSTVAETTTKESTTKSKSKEKSTSTSKTKKDDSKTTSSKAKKDGSKVTAASTTGKIVTTKKAPAAKKDKQSAVSCTVNVECKSILDNMGSLKDGHEEFVPSDGYIIKDYKYTAKKGYTAYDVLKAACKDNDIKLTARSTSYGVYISGINNLDEFDCGKQSGWLYSVNGKYPNTTCGNVTVTDGDAITFEYTCSY